MPALTLRGSEVEPRNDLNVIPFISPGHRPGQLYGITSLISDARHTPRTFVHARDHANIARDDAINKVRVPRDHDCMAVLQWFQLRPCNCRYSDNVYTAITGVHKCALRRS